MKIIDNEVFLYMEKSFPIKRSINQRLFEDNIYPWKYACTSRDIVKNSEIKDIEAGRILENDLESLTQKLVSFYDSINKKDDLIILSNPLYRGEFISDGSHSCAWTHREKGVDEKTLDSFWENLERRGINASYKIMNMRAKYLFE